MMKINQILTLHILFFQLPNACLWQYQNKTCLVTWVFVGSTYTKNLSKFINIPKFLVISIEDRVCNFFLSDFWGGWHDKCYRWNFVTWRTKFLLLVMKTECFSRVNDFLNYILMLWCCYHFIWEKENWSLEFDIWFDNLWRRTFTNMLKKHIQKCSY